MLREAVCNFFCPRTMLREAVCNFFCPRTMLREAVCNFCCLRTMLKEIVCNFCCLRTVPRVRSAMPRLLTPVQETPAGLLLVLRGTRGGSEGAATIKYTQRNHSIDPPTTLTGGGAF